MRASEAVPAPGFDSADRETAARWRPWLALGALYLVLVALTAAWVSIDRRPAEWDHANHLERALTCHRRLADGRWAEALGTSAFYPPLVPCAAGLLYFAFPVVPMTAQVVMLAFLALGLASVFAVGRRLWDERAGLLAAFLFGTAPFVVYSLLNFQLDLPLAAMVALTLAVLLRAGDLRHPGWCAVLGLVMGLGLLTKPTYPVYVGAPVLAAMLSAIRRRERGPALGGAVLALAIAAAIALPWYGPRLIGMPLQVVDRSFKQAAEADQAGLFTWGWLLFYPRVFGPQFGLIAAAACVWGLWALRKDRGARGFLWLAVIPAFAVFSLIQNRNLRYTLPLLPAAALVATAAIRGLRRPWGTGVTAAAVALGAVQLTMVTFAVPRPPFVSAFGLPLVISAEPDGSDWNHDRILDDLARAAGGRPATVSVVPNYNFLSVSNLRYEAMLRELPLRMMRAWTGPPLGVDLIVLKTGSQGPAFSAAKPEAITRAFAGGDPDLAAVFPVIAEHPLPDGSRAIIRARDVPPVVGISAADLAAKLEQAREAAMADFVRDAEGLRVTVDYRPEAIVRGLVDRVRVEVDTATIGELKRRDRAPLRVRDVRIEVDDLLVNPHRLVRTGAIEVLDAGALRIDRARVTQADLDALLAGQPVGAWLNVRFADGWAEVQSKKLPGSARVALAPGTPTAPFVLRVADLRVAGVPIPGAFANWVVRHFDPTGRLRDLPVPVSIAPIAVKDGRLEIGAPDGPRG